MLSVPPVDLHSGYYPGHYSLGILDAPKHGFVDTQGAEVYTP